MSYLLLSLFFFSIHTDENYIFCIIICMLFFLSKIWSYQNFVLYIKAYIFHNMKFDFKGHWRSHKYFYLNFAKWSLIFFILFWYKVIWPNYMTYDLFSYVLPCAKQRGGFKKQIERFLLRLYQDCFHTENDYIISFIDYLIFQQNNNIDKKSIMNFICNTFLQFSDE